MVVIAGKGRIDSRITPLLVERHIHMLPGPVYAQSFGKLRSGFQGNSFNLLGRKRCFTKLFGYYIPNVGINSGKQLIAPAAELTLACTCGVHNPAVDVDNVQLRTDDGQAHITIMPDYTIRSQTPTSMVTQAPGGKVTAEADTEINLVCPVLNIRANSIKMQGKDGGRTTATLDADIEQTGWHRSTGDQVAGGKSLMHHTHPGDSGGTTGEPI